MGFAIVHVPWATKIEEFPSQENTLVYDGSALHPIWANFNEEQMEIVGGTQSETNAGTYYTEFVPLRKYVFPNGTKKKYFAAWTINKAAGILTLSENSGEVKIDFTKTFTVSRAGDGVISVSSSNEDIAVASVSGSTVTIHGVSVGNATITVSVAEGSNYLATSKVYSVRSSKTQVTIPTVTNTSLTYSGYYQSPTITNAPSSSIATRTGTASAVNYSSTAYSFTYTLISPHAYEWTDGTTTSKTFSWRINKKVFSVPAQSGTLTYTGYSQLPSWNFGSTNLISITISSQTDVGTYSATFRLNNTDNCQWSDGTVTDKSANWKIDKARVTVPSQYGTISYDGNSKTPSWNNYNTSLMNIGGTYQNQTNAGTYSAIFTLKDSKNYIWSDGTTTANHTVSWVITSLTLAKPYISGSSTFTYNGNSQGPRILNYNETHMNQSGTLTATNVGSYTATYALKNTNGAKWTDNTTSNVSLPWSIQSDGTDEIEFWLLENNVDSSAVSEITIQSITNTTYTQIYRGSNDNNPETKNVLWHGSLPVWTSPPAFNSSSSDYEWNENVPNYAIISIENIPIAGSERAFWAMRGKRKNTTKGGLPDSGPQSPYGNGNGYAWAWFRSSDLSKWTGERVWDNGPSVSISDGVDSKTHYDEANNVWLGVFNRSWYAHYSESPHDEKKSYHDFRTYFVIPASEGYPRMLCGISWTW